MPSGLEDGRTLSSSREVILQGERTQVWREVMLLTGLFTGTFMSITSAVYIAGTLSGEQEMVTAAEYCLPRWCRSRSLLRASYCVVCGGMYDASRLQASLDQSKAGRGSAALACFTCQTWNHCATSGFSGRKFP